MADRRSTPVPPVRDPWADDPDQLRAAKGLGLGVWLALLIWLALGLALWFAP